MKTTKGKKVEELFREMKKNVSLVKRLRKMGASDLEISDALGIPIDDPVLQK